MTPFVSHPLSWETHTQGLKAQKPFPQIHMRSGKFVDIRSVSHLSILTWAKVLDIWMDQASVLTVAAVLAGNAVVVIILHTTVV